MDFETEVLEMEQKKMMRRCTREQKKNRRPQEEQTHRVKVKYDRKAEKRKWMNSILGGDDE